MKLALAILAFALSAFAAEWPTWASLEGRTVEKELGVVTSVTFTCIIQHPTLEEHFWTKVEDKEKPVDGKFYEFFDGAWQRDGTRFQQQTVEITVPITYAKDSYSTPEQTNVHALLIAELVKRRADWVEAGKPKADPKQRVTLGKVDAQKLVGVSAAAVEP